MDMLNYEKATIRDAALQFEELALVVALRVVRDCANNEILKAQFGDHKTILQVMYFSVSSEDVLNELFNVIGVDSFDQIADIPVRLKTDNEWGGIQMIGHATEDKWFDFSDFLQ